MPRGKAAPDGSTYTAQNGYHYTKRGGRYTATHVLMMEEHLGRKLEPTERVTFKNSDRTDLRLDNLEVRIKGQASLETQRARLLVRRDELNAQIAEIDREIELKKARSELTRLTS